MCGPVVGTTAEWRVCAAKAHLVRVQEGMADDVLADVGCRGQAVQPVEQFYTGDVMLPGLLVQLIPKHTSHSLDREETVSTQAVPARFHLVPGQSKPQGPSFYLRLLCEALNPQRNTTTTQNKATPAQTNNPPGVLGEQEEKGAGKNI